jgi:transposase
VQAGTGAAVFGAQVAASERGYAQALRLAGREAPGRRTWAIEGTGSYGAGLARFLARRGERVLKVGRTKRERRSHAKTDALDALRAASSVLGEAKLASPCAAGEREALRALMVARAGALAAKKAGLCQLRALLVTCPEPLRSELRSLTRARLLARLAAVRPNRHQDPELRGTLIGLCSLARRAQALTAEERELRREIQALVAQLAPALLDEPGVGPASAAQVLVSWSHRGRFRGDAAFARLAGAAPIPASSGLVRRHRLDPGGDRQLNRALHTIVVSRRKHDPATIAYVERRRAEGKSVREAIRCLKRYLARHLYRLLEAGRMAA